MGIIIFVFILLMFQALRLTEFVLVHGVKWTTVGQIALFMSISFLPAILPMSLLFSVLLSYGRLSGDSEIVALKASGLSQKHLGAPALVLGIVVAILSAKVSFELAPWGNRQFELLMTKIGQSKASATIKQGVFSEGFFDLIVYANKVDSKKGHLKDVFIYDERDSELPLTIIAKEGQLINDEANPKNKALLRLLDGNIHRTSLSAYTKVDFSTYDINLFDPVKEAWRSKSLPSLRHNELLEKIKKNKVGTPDHRKFTAEYHKRWALAVGCIIFSLLGVNMGSATNRRTAKSGGMVLSLLLIIGYWTLYVTSENMARKGTLPAVVAIWLTNAFYIGLTYWAARRNRAS